MWRGYGKDTGIAFVFKPEVFTSNFDVFPIYTGPVEYIPVRSFSGVIQRITDNVQVNREFVESVPKSQLWDIIVMMIKFASVSIKHSGFKEEKEWRVIVDLDNPSHLRQDTLVVNGVSQIILKNPLTTDPDDSLDEFSMDKNLDHIIIGPTQYLKVIKEVLVVELKKCGVTNPAQKVAVSDIPFRG